jgi:hypothetical protein
MGKDRSDWNPASASGFDPGSEERDRERREESQRNLRERGLKNRDHSIVDDDRLSQKTRDDG